MVDGEPNTGQQSCCSMAMFVSAQQAPAGRAAMGGRWTLMGHLLTYSRRGLAGFGVLCTLDALLTSSDNFTHTLYITLAECKTILLVPCAVSIIPAE